MPRKSNKQSELKESVEVKQDSTPAPSPQPLSATRDDYIKARAVIQLYRENQKQKPKRKCSEKQLAALAGRAKNQKFTKKKDKLSD